MVSHQQGERFDEYGFGLGAQWTLLACKRLPGGKAGQDFAERHKGGRRRFAEGRTQGGGDKFAAGLGLILPPFCQLGQNFGLIRRPAHPGGVVIVMGDQGVDQHMQPGAQIVHIVKEIRSDVRRVQGGLSGASHEQLAERGKVIVDGGDGDIGAFGDHGVGRRNGAAFRVQANGALDDSAPGLPRGDLASVGAIMTRAHGVPFQTN